MIGKFLDKAVPAVGVVAFAWVILAVATRIA